MKRMGSLPQIERRIADGRAACAALGVPFHADALAAALGIPYDTLKQYASENGNTAALLRAALQECTAAVLSHAMVSDPKHHAFYMWYLRNRGSFSDKEPIGGGMGGVMFIGEGRI